MKILRTVLLVIGILQTLHGSKILAIFPTPCQSHYILGEALLRGLVAKGHHVTMMSPYGLKEPIANYNHVKIEGTEEIKKQYWSKFMNVHTPTWKKIVLAKDMFPLLYQTVHNNTNVKKFVQKREKYDLCIVSFSMMESMYAVCNAVQAPAIGFNVIGLSSLLTYHTSNPVAYANVPNPFLGFSGEMTFLQRVLNTITWMSFDAFNKFVMMPHHAYLVKQYYPDAPPLEDMLDNVDLYLLNSHPSTDSPKALLPNIIPIGGFHMQVMDDIPKDLKEFLDKSKKGVIYFNLGTNAKSSDLDENTMNALLKTFEKLDYDILWKYEDVLPNKPKNVRTEKWLPQRPILNHPNVKIFMTHGGLGGIAEAVYGGVPMICMSIFGDQEKNCAESVNNGFALLLKLTSVTEETLTKTIQEIERNPSYKQKIMLKSDLYRNQEINPMNKAIFWVEHVIRHNGAKHLKTKSIYLPWYQYYLIDVVAFISLVVILALLLTKIVANGICKLLCGRVKKSSKSDKKKKSKAQ